jgi:mono/diheme cytochrome c family protein
MRAALLPLALVLAASAADAGERSGRTNYILRCSGCHLLDGSGLPASGIPALPGYIDTFVQDEDGRTYVTHVPGVVASGLTDGEIADVLNYVVAEWGTPTGSDRFTETEVARRRAENVPDVVAYRRAVVARLKATGVAVADYPWP